MLEIRFKNNNESQWINFEDKESFKYLLDCGWEMIQWRI